MKQAEHSEQGLVGAGAAPGLGSASIEAAAAAAREARVELIAVGLACVAELKLTAPEHINGALLGEGSNEFDFNNWPREFPRG